MAVLEVKNLTKKYGEDESEVMALNQVSFSVEKGEFVTIIGSSGSGKSTLMNLIGGIDYPTSGSVLIDGKDISPMTEDELAIFLFPALSCFCLVICICCCFFLVYCDSFRQQTRQNRWQATCNCLHKRINRKPEFEKCCCQRRTPGIVFRL